MATPPLKKSNLENHDDLDTDVQLLRTRFNELDQKYAHLTRQLQGVHYSKLLQNHHLLGLVSSQFSVPSYSKLITLTSLSIDSEEVTSFDGLGCCYFLKTLFCNLPNLTDISALFSLSFL
ncbi:hypothetical protein RCL1_003791 [Eukaryota sp. TZLM3-RCL]